MSYYKIFLIMYTLLPVQWTTDINQNSSYRVHVSSRLVFVHKVVYNQSVNFQF